MVKIIKKMKKIIKISDLEKTSYSMAEVADLLGFKNNRKLYQFLRRYNIVQGSEPVREFLIVGYFEQHFKEIKNKEEKTFKLAPLIRVTPKGVLFINELYQLLTKDFYVSPFRK